MTEILADLEQLDVSELLILSAPILIIAAFIIAQAVEFVGWIFLELFDFIREKNREFRHNRKHPEEVQYKKDAQQVRTILRTYTDWSDNVSKKHAKQPDDPKFEELIETLEEIAESMSDKNVKKQHTKQPDNPEFVAMMGAMAESIEVLKTLNNIIQSDEHKRVYAPVLDKYRESFNIVQHSLKQIERHRIMSADVHVRIKSILMEPLKDIESIRESNGERVLRDLEDEIETLRRIRKNKLLDIT